MALTAKRAAFFDVDNTLIRGSTLYFLGKGMYQRGYFTKRIFRDSFWPTLDFVSQVKKIEKRSNVFKMLPQILLVVTTLKI
jgi:hypothetical protein